MLAKKIQRYVIMDKHREWVRSGQLLEARNLLILLRLGSIRLGFGDADYATEVFLERIGLRPRYSRNFNTCTFRL